MARVEEVDAALKFINDEAAQLMRMDNFQRAWWAQRKVESLKQVKGLLEDLRRDVQMRGPSGTRIDR